MTTTPQEPLENPEVVPSGDPDPIETPDPPAPGEQPSAPGDDSWVDDSVV